MSTRCCPSRLGPGVLVLCTGWLACAPSGGDTIVDAGRLALADAAIERPTDAAIERPTDAAIELPPVLPDDFSCQPTLASLRDTLFVVTCQWDTCHSNNGAAWGLGLIDEVDAIRDRLVGRDAPGCADWQLVVPGQPERSLLWNKLAVDPPACGDRMPWGLPALPPEAIACVEGWIRSLPDDR